MSTKNKKDVPLPAMLKAIDSNQLDFYESMDPQEQAAWSAWLAMRWASSAQGSLAYHYLLMVNSLVNVDFSTLRHHPNLQWKLLSVCGCGQPVKHTWIAPGKRGKKSQVLEFLMWRYPESNPKDLETWSQIMTPEEITELAKDAGMDPKDIKKLVSNG